MSVFSSRSASVVSLRSFVLLERVQGRTRTRASRCRPRRSRPRTRSTSVASRRARRAAKTRSALLSSEKPRASFFASRASRSSRPSKARPLGLTAGSARPRSHVRFASVCASGLNHERSSASRRRGFELEGDFASDAASNRRAIHSRDAAVPGDSRARASPGECAMISATLGRCAPTEPRDAHRRGVASHARERALAARPPPNPTRRSPARARRSDVETRTRSQARPKKKKESAFVAVSAFLPRRPSLARARACPAAASRHGESRADRPRASALARAPRVPPEGQARRRGGAFASRRHHHPRVQAGVRDARARRALPQAPVHDPRVLRRHVPLRAPADVALVQARREET